jgi:hypothetical protein
MKMTCLSEECSAAAGGKSVFFKTLKNIIWHEAPRKTFLHNPKGFYFPEQCLAK